jgi:MFS family permease
VISSSASSTRSPQGEEPNPLPDDVRARNASARRIVFLTVFLDLLGFGILIPQLGLYAAQFGASPSAIGWLASIYSVMQFVFAPFWGKLSDRLGRRPVLLWSILGTALSYYLFAWSNSIEWLFLSRIFAGITGANIGVAQAYISDVTPEAERFKSFGLFGAMFGIGFAIGPLLGSLFATLPGAWGGNFGIGIITGSLSLFNFLLALKILPETLTPAVRRANRERHDKRSSWWKVIEPQSFRRAFAVPHMKLTIAISFISIVAFSTLTGTFTLFIMRQYTRPEVQTLIKTNPQAAINQARTHLKNDTASSTRTVAAMTESAAPVEADNKPYALQWAAISIREK